MVRQNHATIKMNRKCAGNQYFLIDDEGHDGGNKSKEHGGHVTQVSFTSKFYLLDLEMFRFDYIRTLNICYFQLDLSIVKTNV